jgi:hypothetical protein
MTIRPPRRALGGEPRKQLNQTGVPVVQLGRVGARNSQQPVDVVGTVVLRNVSVITDNGVITDSPYIEADRKWLVSVDHQSSVGERVDVVQDVQLDVALTTQATK